TALELRAALAARRGAASEQAAARARLAALLDAWAHTLPAAERAAALARPDRARVRRAVAPPAAPGLARLVEVAAALALERDTARLINLTLNATLDVTRADRGILLFQDEQGRHRAAASRHIDEGPEAGELLGLSSTIARRALQDREVVVSQDVRGDPRFRDC